MSAARLLVLAVTWTDDGPHLRVRHGAARPSELVPVAGSRLGYRVGNEPDRTCLGHVPFRGRRDYRDCDRSPVSGTRLCDRCAAAEATFAANLHHAHTRGWAELDPAIRDHLDQPNRLYLAGFRDGSIKIGTSTLARSRRRLAEQGAWRARIIAETTNGRVVRRLEDDVSERLGIGQSVARTRKRRGLTDPITDEQLDEMLADAADLATAAVVSPAVGESVTALDERWRHPMADHPALDRPIDYPLRVDRGRHELELLTAVGRLLLARRPGGEDVFVVDPSAAFGLWLEIGDFGSDEIAIQDSLF